MYVQITFQYLNLPDKQIKAEDIRFSKKKKKKIQLSLKK